MVDDAEGEKKRLRRRRNFRALARRRFEREEARDARRAEELGIEWETIRPRCEEEGFTDPLSVTRTERTDRTRTERTDVHLKGPRRGSRPPLSELFGDGPFCFTVRRMRRTWRAADRRADAEGTPADLTISATRARRQWYELFQAVIERDVLVRVRNARYDRPVVLISEARFRRLERSARSGSDATG